MFSLFMRLEGLGTPFETVIIHPKGSVTVIY